MDVDSRMRFESRSGEPGTLALVGLGVLGLIFIGLFSVLTLRLWQIQVNEATTYEEQAGGSRFIENWVPPKARRIQR